MKNKNHIDNQIRTGLLKVEKKIILTKFLKKRHIRYMDKVSLWSRMVSDKLSNKKNKTKIVNRCIYTGRSNGVSRKYKLSRIVLREEILKGNVSGMSKYSW